MQLIASRACRRAPGYQRLVPRNALYQYRLANLTPIRFVHPQNGGVSKEVTKYGRNREPQSRKDAIDAEKERLEKIRRTTKEPWNNEVAEKARKARELREANIKSSRRPPTPKIEEEPPRTLNEKTNKWPQQPRLQSSSPLSTIVSPKFRLWQLKWALRCVNFLDRYWTNLNKTHAGKKDELRKHLPSKYEKLKSMDDDLQKKFKYAVNFLEKRIRIEEDLGTISQKYPNLDQQVHRFKDSEQPISPKGAFIHHSGKKALDLPAIDQKWQSFWEERRGATPEATQDVEEKMYILPMFPYPSGDLHLGHLRVYTISDVLSRFRRMQGYNVLHPIGWDAFGLPAENAAIERGIDPATWTATNIQKMKSQLKLMNGHWDWDREFATSDPNFYGFTQYLFHELHAHDLVYQKESLVNYDPVDKTVLANEQVDSQGYSWRSGAKVEKRMLKQWFLRITKYRDELLDDLKVLQKDGAWPDRVLAMQKNWLGKSAGARIKFSVAGDGQQSSIEVFTTRPDTLFGVQYLALASTHPLVQKFAKTDTELQAFLDSLPTLPDESKDGYLLKNVHAINPLTEEESTPEATKKPLPIYVAPYVLGDYGDGAVMGVPGHDTRDYAFWRNNRKDDSVRFVLSSSQEESATSQTKPLTSPGYLNSLSGSYAGLSTAEASSQIVESLTAKDLGCSAETWRLRDWLISRQRYWGTPIPIIHCEKCGPVPVPLSDLPVKLPPMEEHWERGKTGNPLEHAHDWINTLCPSCGAEAKRDTDTMDTFVDSSWYFMRFVDPNNKDLPFSINNYRQWLPVDLYIGGVEHAILHLLYARFFSKFIATYCEFDEEKYREPFKRLLTQGMVHGKTYSDPHTGRFLKPDEVDLSDSAKPVVVATGEQACISFEKMSKSKYNGVDPGTCIARYGADATRAHMLFQAPVSEVLEWDENKISGVLRWMRRIHEFITSELFAEHRKSALFANQSAKEFLLLQQHYQTGPNAAELTRHVKELGRAEGEELLKLSFAFDKKMWRTTQGVIISVNKSLSETYALNTVISDLMGLTNFIIDETSASATPTFVTAHAVDALIKMMAPITPAFAEECWQIMHPPCRTSFNVYEPTTTSIFDQSFPEEDGTYDMLAPDTMSCSVQINGKFKLAVEIPIPDMSLNGKALENWMMKRIMATEQGKKKFGVHADGKMGVDLSKARKVIVVGGGKTVNFVV